FREHIARITPRTVRSQVRGTSYAKPALVPRDHPAMRAAAVAYRLGFGAEPVFLRVGGSLPVVNSFQEILGIPTVLMGFALPDDRLHGPNEKFHLPNFFNGIATSIFFLREMGKISLQRGGAHTGMCEKLEASARWSSTAIAPRGKGTDDTGRGIQRRRSNHICGVRQKRASRAPTSLRRFTQIMQSRTARWHASSRADRSVSPASRLSIRCAMPVVRWRSSRK